MCMRHCLVTLLASSTTVLASVAASRGVDDAASLPIARRSSASSSGSSYLAAQVGGIVGSYAASLVVVALLLIALSKRRREHLESGQDFDYLQETQKPFSVPQTLQLQDSVVSFGKTPVNFSFPQVPQSPTAKQPYIVPVINTTFAAPGINLSVDQEVVSADREVAQSQLEEMYKYVLEQDEAKAKGITLHDPPASVKAHSRQNSGAPMNVTSVSSLPSMAAAAAANREKINKASTLTLNLGKEEKKESRASALLSALKSPRKKKMQCVSISSPIMTPMSGTFPHYGESEEMNTIPPRFYAPLAPPPVPVLAETHRPAEPATSDPAAGLSAPEAAAQTIDQRIGTPIVTVNLPKARETQLIGLSPADPESATSHVSHVSQVSHSSTAPLVGLPSSPKPNVTRFPSLPTSPRASTFAASPTASIARSNAPSAVRTGGTLPLRAYEPSLASPSATTHMQTKQTVFERTMPQSPTPWTGAPVPYSPYQPFSPVVPMTPSLVTKADRRRMRRLEPKTPTMEMVKSTDETW